MSNQTDFQLSGGEIYFHKSRGGDAGVVLTKVTDSRPAVPAAKPAPITVTKIPAPVPESPIEQIRKQKVENPQMSVSIMVDVVKKGLSHGFKRSEFYNEMVNLAKAARKDGETQAQAFTRVVTGTEEGQILYSGYNLAKRDEFVPTVQTMKVVHTDAEEKIEKIANEIAEKRGISIVKARIAAWHENDDLYAEYHAERRQLVASLGR